MNYKIAKGKMQDNSSISSEGFLVDNGVLLEYRANNVIVNIPDRINGIQIKKIAANAFRKAPRIKQIKVFNPEMVLEEDCFKGCNGLEDVFLSMKVNKDEYNQLLKYSIGEKQRIINVNKLGNLKKINVGRLGLVYKRISGNEIYPYFPNGINFLYFHYKDYYKYLYFTPYGKPVDMEMHFVKRCFFWPIRENIKFNGREERI